MEEIKIMRQLITLLILIISGQGISQDTIPLPVESVDVVKRFEPKTKDSKPINYSPELLITDDLKPLSIGYEYPDEPLAINYPDPVIRPLVYENPREKRSRTGYLRGGYGNLNSLLIDSEVHYDIEDWLQMGFNVHHYSGRDTATIVNQATSKTDADLYFGYFLTELTKVTLAIDTELENRTLSSDSITSLDLRKSTGLETYGARLSLDHNSFSVSGLSTKQNIFASRISSQINDEQEWKYNYSSSSNKSIGDKGLLNLKLGFEYLDGLDSLNNNYQWSVAPNMQYDFKNFKASIGAFASNADTLFIRPIVELNYLLPILDASVELSFIPESRINSFHTLNKAMPYLARFNVPEYKNHRLETLRLGMRRADEILSSYIGFLAKFHKEVPIFEVINEDYQFGPNYYNYNEYGLEFNSSLKKFELLEFSAEGVIRAFRKDGELFENAWLPMVELGLRAEQYLLNKTIKFYQSLIMRSANRGQLVFGNEATPRSIGMIRDLSAGVEITIKKRFGIFAQAYNLLDSPYQYFYNYTTFSRSFHAGLKLLF